jgi:outer membrane beta-barrel protein
MKMLRISSCLFLALCASAAFAADEELVEKAVVRNRLFNVDGHFELGFNVGLSMLSRLTDHYNLNASVAYNLADSLALELRVGYAFSRHTGLANQIAYDFSKNGSITEIKDLSDLWEMNANGVLGLRWQPIYGKISLMAELPVHYQAYLWLGGGAAMLHRESLTICNTSLAKCTEFSDSSGDNFRAGATPFLTNDKIGPVVSVALGWRFFLNQKHAVKFEIRDYSYLDSYLEGVNRAAALSASNPTGNGVDSKNPGITNLVQFDFGYAFIF